MLSGTQTTSSLLSQDVAINRVYAAPPFVDSVLTKFVEQFAGLVNAAMAAGKRVVRVLEIGARDGRLTRLLGQALVDAKLQTGYYVDYVCADTEIQSAKIATSSSPWMTMTPVVFDPTLPIEAQGLEPASVDIIVALDALHNSSNIRGTLANLRGMLVPGGYLATIQWDGSSSATSAIGAKCNAVIVALKHCLILLYAGINFVFGSEEWIQPSLSSSELKDAFRAVGYDEPVLISQDSKCISHVAFISQKSHSRFLTNGISNHTDDLTIIRHFSSGDEPQLVAFISGLDPVKPHSIWLHTDTAPSNAALLGLSRALCHEYPDWKISTVLFHPSWNSSRQHEFISHDLIPLKLVNAELKIDELGSISVPRVIEAAAYPKTTPRGSKTVQFDDTQVWHHYPSVLLSDEVQVAVSFVSVSPIFPGCSEFSGVVTATGKNVAEEKLLGKQ